MEQRIRPVGGVGEDQRHDPDQHRTADDGDSATPHQRFGPVAAQDHTNPTGRDVARQFQGTGLHMTGQEGRTASLMGPVACHVHRLNR